MDFVCELITETNSGFINGKLNWLNVGKHWEI